jgi:hypothetical protein
MVNERARRQPTFLGGVPIRLANGQYWSLPEDPPPPDDEEHQLVLEAIREAQDEAERLHAELALTVLLLSRNYRLLPGDYQAILGYAPGDPAQAEMQAAVSALASRQCAALDPHFGAASNPPALRPLIGRLSALVKRPNRAGPSSSPQSN